MTLYMYGGWGSWIVEVAVLVLGSPVAEPVESFGVGNAGIGLDGHAREDLLDGNFDPKEDIRVSR